MGYQVDAFDASSELVGRARKFTAVPISLFTFNDLCDVERYDGLCCCASLLHVPKLKIFIVFNKLTRALKPGGILYASFTHVVI
jgi:2-polyprenyl-3-methyl-5-hydroxy-6-metoxy-1,4-benzoquinol methylase